MEILTQRRHAVCAGKAIFAVGTAWTGSPSREENKEKNPDRQNKEK